MISDTFSLIRLDLDARVGNRLAEIVLPFLPLFPAHFLLWLPHQGSVTNPPSITDGVEHGPSTSAPSPASGDTTKADEDAAVGDAEPGTEEAAPTPMEVDKEKAEDSKTQTPVPPNPPASQQQQQQQQQQQPSGQGQGPSQSQQPSKDGAPQIDLLLEASKLPLDVAIFNSARAAGGDDKIRKYLQAVLVVGGTGLTQGIAHALESRCGPRFRFSFCHEFLYENELDEKVPPVAV